jgi:hypothetical protein
MGGVVDSIFGGGGGDVETYSPAQIIGQFPGARSRILDGINFDTGLSTLDPNTGTINIDPTGRNLNLGGLDEFRTRTGETRAGLLGNQGAFMNARVAPLLDQLTKGRGALERNLNRTSVRGTLRDRSLLDYDIAGGRALGDQRALATAESLNAVNQLDNALFNASTGVGTNIFNQELSSLGLSTEAINNLNAIAANLTTGAASTAVASEAAAADADAARGANIAGAIGSALTAYGAYAAVPSSKHFKEDHGVVEHGVLDKLLDLDMHKWNYKGQESTHIGPWAEDFNAIIGKESQYIELVDVMGVMLMATKELIQEVRNAKSG